MQPDRRGLPDRFLEAGLRIAVQPRALGPRLGLDMDHEGGARQVARAVIAGLGLGYAFSFSTAVSSCNWIGPSGMTVEIACL